MSNHFGATIEFMRVAASPGPIGLRAWKLLASLRRSVPFDGGWIAHSDCATGTSHPVAVIDLPDRTSRLLADASARLQSVAENARLGPGWDGLGDPPDMLDSWPGIKLPGGDSVAWTIALVASDRRRVGLLALTFRDDRSPTAQHRLLLRQLSPVIAGAIDPMQTLLGIAGLVERPIAGSLIRRDGTTEPFPGLEAAGPLCLREPRLMTLADAALAAGRLHSSFIWPKGPPGRGQVRTTVLACPHDGPPSVRGMVLLSPPGHLHGLTARELEIMGLVVYGYSNKEMSETLFLSRRTVATHMEHILEKLDVATRTLAAVRADREGLYVPPLLRCSP